MPATHLHSPIWLPVLSELSELNLPMEQHKTFSIVIPAYNYADYLPRAVASVCRQDGDDWDLLVINDGSSDNTEAVIEQLRHHYQDKPDVRFVSQRNAGLSAVRNRGIRETSGDYLVFLDADDELCFDALAHFRQHIAAQPGIYFWIGGYISVHEDGREKTYLPGTIPAEPLARVKSYLLSKRLALRCSAVALHRSVFAAYTYPGAIQVRRGYFSVCSRPGELSHGGYW